MPSLRFRGSPQALTLDTTAPLKQHARMVHKTASQSAGRRPGSPGPTNGPPPPSLAAPRQISNRQYMPSRTGYNSHKTKTRVTSYSTLLSQGLRVTSNSLAPFTYEAAPSRVVFGLGSLKKAPEEIDRLGAKRVLILTTPGRKKLGEELAVNLGAKAAGVFGGAVMHVPAETAEAGRTEAARLNADCYVAIGGGSATGLAKAIAVVTGNPILAIPTTYSGSEMTPTWGLTEHGIKKTMRDARARPKTAIYDPALTTSMPAALSATSGMNAIAHCVEALYSQEANPIVSLIAEEGIRALAQKSPCCSEGTIKYRSALASVLRCVARRHFARRCFHGASSQAVPHSRRRLQLATLGNAHRLAPSRDSLQCRSRSPSDGTHRSRSRRERRSRFRRAGTPRFGGGDGRAAVARINRNETRRSGSRRRACDPKAFLQSAQANDRGASLAVGRCFRGPSAAFLDGVACYAATPRITCAANSASACSQSASAEPSRFPRFS